MKIMKIKKMKRLIKKSEFTDGIKTDITSSGMVSIYKNPTLKEIEEAKSEMFGDNIRGTILEDGTIYCWNAVMLHKNMPKQYVPNESFRFAYDGDWILDLHGHYSFEQGMKKCLELKSTLQQFGDVDGLVTFYFASDSGKNYRKFDIEEQIAITIEEDFITFINMDAISDFIDIMNNERIDNNDENKTN